MMNAWLTYSSRPPFLTVCSGTCRSDPRSIFTFRPNVNGTT